MAKKFIIKDDDGKEFEVTEETVDEQPEVTEEPAKPEVKDDESLTPEEIVALKALAAHSADIIKLLSVEAEEHAEDTDEEIADEDADVVDEESSDEDEKEIVVKTGDSKKSVGSIQKTTTKTADSIDVRETDIAQAWADRFKKSCKKGE